MKFITKLILSLIIGGIFAYFLGNLVTGGIIFVVLLILMMIFFRKKKIGPLTPEELEAMRNEKILMNKDIKPRTSQEMEALRDRNFKISSANESFKQGTISKRQYQKIVDTAQEYYIDELKNLRKSAA